MYKIFSQDESYILPDGSSVSGTELLSKYPQLSQESMALDVSGGILVSIENIGQLCESYGFEYSDINDAIIQVNSAKALERSLAYSNKIKTSATQKAAQIMALSFTDEQAIEVADLYPEYEVDHAYKQNDRFQYKGSLYKVNQAHTSAAQWVPGESGTESLYTNLMLDQSGYQIWKQPTGAHDAYNTGDIVRYPDKDGKLYKSTIDGNVWAPDAYPQGWEVYTEE